LNKREFILACSMFVSFAVVATVFSLWFTYTYAPARQAPPTLDSRR
jgi:hypothetical protein